MKWPLRVCADGQGHAGFLGGTSGEGRGGVFLLTTCLLRIQHRFLLQPEQSALIQRTLVLRALPVPWIVLAVDCVG